MYNPSDPGRKGTIFGLPYTEDEAELVFLPINIDVTASYGDGTSKAPQQILKESSQLDLSLKSIQNPWTLKMAMLSGLVASGQNEILRGRAINVIEALEAGRTPEEEEVRYVNEFCEEVLQQAAQKCQALSEDGKLVAVLGGDHSAPLGLIRSLAAHQSFGILQIDAHMDLRAAYEGFRYSHASIMYNAMQLPAVSKLVQVGIRDFCEEEEREIERLAERVSVFFDEEIYQKSLEGISWKAQCEEVAACLPDLVYISFDMDGLEPALCPHTGTPVPGGLSFNQCNVLFDTVVRSGRRIIGFDVCETGNHPWDANVAARMLYRLAAYTGVSAGLLRFR